WTALSGAFMVALRGVDAEGARARRNAYQRWVASRPSVERDQPIAVVLIVREHVGPELVDATLRSIIHQTRAPAELVIVPIGRSSTRSRPMALSGASAMRLSSRAAWWPAKRLPPRAPRLMRYTRRSRKRTAWGLHSSTRPSRQSAMARSCSRDTCMRGLAVFDR